VPSVSFFVRMMLMISEAGLFILHPVQVETPVPLFLLRLPHLKQNIFVDGASAAAEFVD
jgi:hypothetical protein